jgi:hydrogenase/urease accessory protein HupE
MKIRPGFFLLLFLFIVAPAKAHRLNEYLHAATISLEKDSVKIHLRLTAGTDIAGKIIQLIDGDGDGIFSKSEQQQYATGVLQSLQLNIDRKKLTLQISSYSFPTAVDMKNGIGEIQLYLVSGFSSGNPIHQLVLENHHEKAIAVYLVNSLQPTGTGIAITTQSRNADQSIYTLDFATAPGVAHAKTDFQKEDHYAVIKTYLIHGIKHILFGFDHLLFLCALVLGASSLWQLVKIVTAFTIAHSISLTLAVLHLVNLPVQLIEIFISGSIVFVALQNIYWTPASKRGNRLLVAFIFGLFHGLGFAGGLLEMMHSAQQPVVLYAILGFTFGIEAGNQVVLLPLYAVLKIARNNPHRISEKIQTSDRIQKIASVPIVFAGLYYLAMAVFG